MLKYPHLAAMVAVGMLASACVTINIYFPAAAAEKAADRIIDQVWQLKQDAAKKSPTEAVPVQPDSTK